MKKTILVFAASTLFVVGGLLTSCNSPAKKVEIAENEVTEANKDVNEANKGLDEAQEEYKEEIRNYRQETADKIAANDKSLAEFRARVATDKKEAREEYNMKINKLEEKNTDLKKKMDDYKEDSKENWEKFKTEFSHDLDELGAAFKDFTVKNTK